MDRLPATWTEGVVVMISKLLERLVLAAGLASLSACASIVSDNDSTTYISTEPEEARCELHGQDFKRVVNTPTSITLPADAAPITVACNAEGFQTTTAELDTSMDGWIVGNIIFGGLIGFAIDAARGAGQKFPPQIALVLDPESFDSNADLEAWYTRRRAELEKKWSRAMDEAKSRCARGQAELCNKRQANLEKARDEELEALERKRDNAQVGS